jgi:cobalamin synthase
VTERYSFDTREEFLGKLEELVASGVPKKAINTFTPYPVHQAEELLDHTQSPVRFFTGVGAVTGCLAGFAFTIYTVLSWPLITGGKELVSIPAFIVIAYELTILFGGLIAFGGFLFLTRLPVFRNILSDKTEFSRKFEITVERGGAK